MLQSGMRVEKMVGETLKERTTRLEQLLREWPNEEGIMTSWVDKI